MSRFEQEYHRRLLDEPKPWRLRNMHPLLREQRLWNYKEFIDNLSSPIFQKRFVISVGILGLLFAYLSKLLAQDVYLWVGIIAAFGSMLLISTSLSGYNVWLKKRAKGIIANRDDAELEGLILNSPSIQKYNRYHVKAIRQTLGHIYSVSPKKIYLSDTPASLRTLGCAIEPYSFELILGVGKRLGIILSEAEVDRIAQRIYNNAHNVEELTGILCEEILLAEAATGAG